MRNAKSERLNIVTQMDQESGLNELQQKIQVLEKIKRSEERTKKEGSISQKEIERKLSTWTNFQ